MTIDELTRRALEVSKQYDLTYMVEMEGWLTDEGPAPEIGRPARYMIVSRVDLDDNMWVNFAANRSNVSQVIRAWVNEPCCLEAVYDLEAEDFMEPLDIACSVVVRWPSV